MPPRSLTVLTRADCELCSSLLGLLEPYARAGAVVLELQDFDAAPAAVRAQQQWRIPVVSERDEELMWGRIDADELARVLGPCPGG